MGKSGKVIALIVNSRKRINKRGQFFLLAALIISVVIISLGAGTNKITTNDEPDNFYDFALDSKREINSVLDFQVFEGIEDDEKLEAFVGSLSEEVLEVAPGADFVFVYGNETEITTRSYVSGSYVGKICWGGNSDNCQDIEIDEFTVKEVVIDEDMILEGKVPGKNEIELTVMNVTFLFPLTDQRKVYFIMRKNDAGDEHVIIE